MLREHISFLFGNKASDRKRAATSALDLDGSRPDPGFPATTAMNLHGDIERILFDETEIRDTIDRLAESITAMYGGIDFTVVSVLKGSCVFASDLIRRIPVPLELAFLGVSSYGQGTESGPLEITFLPGGNEIEGRNLLLVDDILDTGRTLQRVRTELEGRGARDVKTCVFLDKPSRRVVPITPDARGFEVEDTFVVGYGLDFRGRYRNLPYVGALRAEVLARQP
jgi:hypoxanthine phosphoribosyltransferase